MGRYLVVLRAPSQLRLMEKTIGRPGSWLLQKDDPGEPQVRIRDDVLEEDRIPWHRGMTFEVTCDAATIEDAVTTARGEAEAAAILLAAAARAPLGPVRPVLAVDVSPGVKERAFRQWYYGGTVWIGKTVVTPEAFGAFHRALLEQGGAVTTDRKVFERMLLSLSWYRLALDETDHLARFMHLWLALESLESRLARHFGCDSRGFGGLRALAEQHVPGEGSEQVSAALNVRRKLFHPQRVNVATLKEMAGEQIEPVERLLHEGWGAILGVDDLHDRLPSQSVTAYDDYMLVHATIVHEDETFGGRLPYMVSALRPHRERKDDPDHLYLSYGGKLSLRNAEFARLHGFEIRGPKGPNVGEFITLGDEEVSGEDSAPEGEGSP